MKMISTLLAATLSIGLASAALATEFTKGTVKKIDSCTNKITIIHEPLVNLDMPAMTMVFRAGSDDILARLKEGQEIEFVAERVKGKLTVVELK